MMIGWHDDKKPRDEEPRGFVILGWRHAAHYSNPAIVNEDGESKWTQ